MILVTYVCMYVCTSDQCMYVYVCIYVCMYICTRAPDAGGWGPTSSVEVFVFELRGTHELHTIDTTYQVATT